MGTLCEMMEVYNAALRASHNYGGETGICYKNDWLFARTADDKFVCVFKPWRAFMHFCERAGFGVISTLTNADVNLNAFGRLCLRGTIEEDGTFFVREFCGSKNALSEFVKRPNIKALVAIPHSMIEHERPKGIVYE
ncbi:MAG: hypothetical protein AAGD43_07985 [Pseudomonadota bacterium]